MLNAILLAMTNSLKYKELVTLSPRYRLFGSLMVALVPASLISLFVLPTSSITYPNIILSTAYLVSIALIYGLMTITYGVKLNLSKDNVFSIRGVDTGDKSHLLCGDITEVKEITYLGSEKIDFDIDEEAPISLMRLPGYKGPGLAITSRDIIYIFPTSKPAELKDLLEMVKAEAST